MRFTIMTAFSLLAGSAFAQMAPSPTPPSNYGSPVPGEPGRDTSGTTGTRGANGFKCLRRTAGVVWSPILSNVRKGVLP